MILPLVEWRKVVARSAEAVSAAENHDLVEFVAYQHSYMHGNQPVRPLVVG